ncbi:hypothetical protein H6G54_02910 [Anabaena cylindrica FACHB-243]|uniref:Uncharacterized protein n=1 Tax=Anabaena cylindrica (strain ATCC 27899 / PCC 7122) TaxID=272123 RepID=K9ZSC9_ANACC|nr:MULTISPECIES: hypothetical protein [Anabaena]AFZ61255.1 hypothetical protein Anacy_5972 [Anabaena cylindrica PCC 7122]MBD2416674.1 hypothetical protein [Anabaena cylindrica FACHB-243]MBY5284611.1 hypothetical protein [Anabaena sp. CCAP 1446/1C]MBY5308423.1 hypothetical protein [Anabaena sp. CCAP 1446/1C]MCM2408693.1 hypothetical protein [Anabaena sp. CCAP 1446/1C]
MSTTSIIHPLHYLIVKREGTTWYFKPGNSVFYNPKNVPVNLALGDRLHRFGLTPQIIMIELFRINGGKAGFYLADLQDKQYYYCGTDLQDVNYRLHCLGIGSAD